MALSIPATNKLLQKSLSDNGKIRSERDFPSLILALLKRNWFNAIENIITNKIFRVSLHDEKLYYQYLDKITSQISALQKILQNPPKVEVMTKSPPIEFGEIIIAIENLKNAVIAQKQVKLPEFPNKISFAESNKLLSTLEQISKKLDQLPKSFPEITIPRTISVDNFPPQKYPMPVSHISVNGLGGYAQSRAVTVTTALTPLPGEVLSNRRAIIIYNNSTQTVEIGGSTFTFGNGLPIPTNTYSPPIDAGSRLIIYGRVTSGTADVRILEVSDTNVGR